MPKMVICDAEREKKLMKRVGAEDSPVLATDWAFAVVPALLIAIRFPRR